VEKFSYSSKHALYFINIYVFYWREDNIPPCEAYKQFGAEPAQYGLEINLKQHFKTRVNLQRCIILIDQFARLIPSCFWEGFDENPLHQGKAK